MQALHSFGTDPDIVQRLLAHLEPGGRFGASSGGHMGVDEVYQAAKKAYPYMDIATVYRTLHLFKDLGVVTEVAIGDRLHFELTDPDGHHHHMVCRACNGAFNLSPTSLDEFRDTLLEEFDFEPDLEHFAS